MTVYGQSLYCQPPWPRPPPERQKRAGVLLPAARGTSSDASHQVSTAYFAEECGGDLTAVQYAALVAIGAHPGIDATRLSEIIYFDRSTIGDVLDRMEGKGWIRRQSTPTTGASSGSKLSPAGQEVLQQVEPGIRRVQERLLAPLTAGRGERRWFVSCARWPMRDAGDAVAER